MPDLPLTLKPLTDVDRATIERLNARAFGPGRFARSAYRLREGVPADPELSCVAWVGTLLVGANLITPIRCGEAPALLLGPLTVDPAFRSRGIGAALVRRSLETARAAGHALVLLVGDLPYYERFGFQHVPEGRLIFCGPVDPMRLLCCELANGAFASAGMLIRPAI